MLRRCGAWWTAGLLVPLVLGGLILMHGVDADPAESVISHVDHMETPAAPQHDGMANGESGSEHGHLAGHITVACVAVLASIALWPVRRIALRNTDAASSPRWRPGHWASRSAPPIWRPPPWIELCVILR